MTSASLAAKAALQPSSALAHFPGSFIVHTSSEEIVVGDGLPAFRVRVPTRSYWDSLWSLDPYRAGLAFVNGDFDIDGDLVAAIEAWALHGHPRTPVSFVHTLLPILRVERWFQSRVMARRNIEFHYDRSNEFYRTFLDRRLVYSCAYFEHPDASIDEAQEAKLDHICRKLDLKDGERFLDVGCGWGALIEWAVEHYGVDAFGCTLSRKQHEEAGRLFHTPRLAGRAHVDLCDYRDLRGRFAKIASIGMVEHVGRSRLRGYFTTLASLLDDSGLLLNHGIVRPREVREDAGTYFLRRHVFPGSELPPLEEMVRTAEQGGFEVLDVENLRPHYALTCRAWVARLREHRAECLRTVDERTYRTWLLYLSSSAVNFSHGMADIYQLLLAKRSPSQRRHMTRRYMYVKNADAA